MNEQAAEPRNKLERWIAAFQIFLKYAPHEGGLDAEHDTVYAGPSPDIVDADDIVTLQELGWLANDSLDCFYAFT